MSGVELHTAELFKRASKRLLTNDHPTWNTPADLLRSGEEYFQWCKEHEIKNVDPKKEAVPYVSTMNSFFLFSGISSTTFHRMLNGETPYESFQKVAEYIHSSITGHMISGAMTGMYRENLTARLVGLPDKVEQTGKDGKDLYPTEIQFTVVTDQGNEFDTSTED